MPRLEVDFQQDLCFLLREILERRPEFRSIRFEAARMEYRVDHGQADIALLLSGGRPFLIVETKRKNGRVQQDIDPLSHSVISQALKYAVQSGAPYVATANPDYLAVFRVPPPGEPFRIERHRVFISPIPGLTAEFATQFLERVVDYHLATEQDRARVATGIDWTFVIRLRSFVDWLTRRIGPSIAQRLETDETFREKVEAFEVEKAAPLSSGQVARQMAYILTNKLVFYKVLKRQYPELQDIDLEGTEEGAALLERLNMAFQEAMVVTEDFEAIFSADIYDEVSFSTERYDLLDVVDGVQGFIDDMETYELERLEADVIGHVYEALIPDHERHMLGQFYTPPAVAEFITRWAVRTPDDVILDPAAGSGTFLVKAYERLQNLKLEAGIRTPPATLHRQIVEQLYAVDINPFPVHLTAMNLAMRNVRHPVSELNTLERDFFQVSPGGVAILPYTTRSPRGMEVRREIKVPRGDVVVANPPYTRWLEIAEGTREAIKLRLGKVLDRYDLTAVIRGGVETAIYQHFVMYGHDFLKPGGRMGMIISNSWLQTDVGVKFANFLADHFKVHAVIDLAARIFPVPLVATCIVLLERCEDEAERSDTESLFAFIDEAVEVDELTELVYDPTSFEYQFVVKKVRQGDLPRDRKWIEVLFGFPELDEKIQGETAPAEKFFDVYRGNIKYCAERKRGLGANDFFYLTEEEVRQRGLRDFVHPCVPSARDVMHLTFGQKDWDQLSREGREAYIFSCSTPRSELPDAARAYIQWGETRCRNRAGTVCAKAQACAERARSADYAGWYDLGGVKGCDLFSFRYAQYRRRFVSLEAPLALDDDFIVFRAREKLKKNDRTAILAFLNSVLGQVYVEIQGRTTGGGLVSMEAKHAEKLRIPNTRRLPRHQVEALVDAYKSLEHSSRRGDGAQSREAMEALSQEYDELDMVAARAIGLDGGELRSLLRLYNALLERRLQRTEQASPEALRGTDQMLESPPSPRRRRREGPPLRRLDEFESNP